MNEPNINPISETDNPFLEEMKQEAIKKWGKDIKPCHGDWEKALVLHLDNCYRLYVNLPNDTTMTLKRKKEYL